MSLVWSVQVTSLDGDVLLAHDPDRVCRTASVGKVFLLIEVAHRLERGELAPDARILLRPEHFVRDSGILYRFRDQRLTVADAALLVGAFSDNLATNALLDLVGLDPVREVAPALGFEHTALLDYIREHRGPEHPWTPSYGTGRELAALMRMLHTGQAVSPTVSAQVLDWLAADADTSMVAAAALLDPLAHVDPDFEGMLLRHKTGTTETARIDTGILTGPAAGVAYAVAANWEDADGDRRAEVLARMRGIGEWLRRHVTGAGHAQHGHELLTQRLGHSSCSGRSLFSDNSAASFSDHSANHSADREGQGA